ncbi:hypothetical protein [Bacillus sp. XB1]
MKCEIHTNNHFVGDFSLSDLFEASNILGCGSLIDINQKRYCIGNVMIRRDGTIVLEVY